MSGIPDGVNFHVGESVDGALTCFCAEELCNEEHFCDGCVAGATTKVPPPTTSTKVPPPTHAGFHCYEGTSGIHGFPLDLQPVNCEAGVVNCAKIAGSKLSKY